MNDQNNSLPESYTLARHALETVHAVKCANDSSLYPLEVQHALTLQELPDEYRAVAMTKLVGALCLEAPNDDIHYIGMLTHYLRSTKELQEQLHTDAVTGFANRRGLDEWSKSYDPYQNTYGILAIDLAGFKKVNDVLGHQTGDDALKVACEVIASQTRQSKHKSSQGADERQHQTTDVLSVARVGGDEIICIMDFNGLHALSAMVAITRVTNHLESRKVSMYSSDRSKEQQFGFRVGALLVGPQNPLPFYEALGMADAFCNAKRGSGDR